MSSNFSLANTIAILQGARNPAWTQQVESPMGLLSSPVTAISQTSGAPDATNSGVSLENSIQCLLFVMLREQAHRRSARIRVVTLDLTGTYTITIGGNAAVYDAGAAGAADLNDVIQGIKTAMVGAPAVAALVTATAVKDDDDASSSLATTVLLRGVAEANWTIVVAASVGTLSAEADALSADVRLWGTHRGTKRDSSSVLGEVPTGWSQINGAEYTSLDYRGFAERFDVGGLDRLYVELSSIAGAGDGGTVTHKVAAYVGPAIAET